MIILSVTGPPQADALEQMRRDRRHADIVELRLDLIRSRDIGELVRAARRPVIATCRPLGEGGRFAGPEERRFDILRAAARAGAAYVDIERKAFGAFVRGGGAGRRGVRLIASLHLPPGADVNAAAAFSRLRATGADILKFAFHATDAADLRHVEAFLARSAKARQPAIGIAMGPFGEASRVLYRKLGGWATYGAPSLGPPSASGQPTAETLATLYHANIIGRKTRVFGLIGLPVEQSKGIFVHNPVLRPGKEVYCRFPVRDLDAFMVSVAPLLDGFSVTTPWKQRVVPYLDLLLEGAAWTRAVNTVVWRGDKLVGANTDGPGALDAIGEAIDVHGAMMLVVGAGGAARAVVEEAGRRGAMVFVANRTERRARLLARDLGVRWVSLKEASCMRFDILVNATTAGMAKGSFPLLRALPHAGVVMDVVYVPPETALLKAARRRGSRVVPGTEMFVRQASLQSWIFTGREPDIGRMRRLLGLALRTRKSSGK